MKLVYRSCNWHYIPRAFILYILVHHIFMLTINVCHHIHFFGLCFYFLKMDFTSKIHYLLEIGFSNFISIDRLLINNDIQIIVIYSFSSFSIFESAYIIQFCIRKFSSKLKSKAKCLKLFGVNLGK